MPYSVKKVRNRSCFRVKNIKTKKVFSKCTTLKRAKKQLNLLNAIKYNKNFVLNRNKVRTPRQLKTLQ